MASWMRTKPKTRTKMRCALLLVVVLLISSIVANQAVAIPEEDEQPSWQAKAVALEAKLDAVLKILEDAGLADTVTSSESSQQQQHKRRRLLAGGTSKGIRLPNDGSVSWGRAVLRYDSASTELQCNVSLAVDGTLDTGMGATEVYRMNQDVRSSDNVQFQSLVLNGGGEVGARLDALEAFVASENSQNILDAAINEALFELIRPVLTAPTLDASGRICRMSQFDLWCVYQFVATDLQSDAPLTFHISNGFLPAGITLNSTTGLLNGTVVNPGYAGPFFNVTVSARSCEPSGLCSHPHEFVIELYNKTFQLPEVLPTIALPRTVFYASMATGSLFDLSANPNYITYQAQENNREYFETIQLDPDTFVATHIDYWISGTGMTLNMGWLHICQLTGEIGLQSYYIDGSSQAYVRGVEISQASPVNLYTTTTATHATGVSTAEAVHRLSDTTGVHIKPVTNPVITIFEYLGGGTMINSATASIPGNRLGWTRLWTGVADTVCDRGSRYGIAMLYTSGNAAYSAATTLLDLLVWEWDGVDNSVLTQTRTNSFITLPAHGAASVQTPRIWTASFGHVLVNFDDATPANAGFFIFTMTGAVPDTPTFHPYTGSFNLYTDFRWVFTGQDYNGNKYMCSEARTNQWQTATWHDDGGDLCLVTRKLTVQADGSNSLKEMFPGDPCPIRIAGEAGTYPGGSWIYSDDKTSLAFTAYGQAKLIWVKNAFH